MSTTVAAVERRGVALCLAGLIDQIAIPQQGGYLRSRVADPLSADVLMLLTYRRSAEPQCKDVKECGDLQRKLARLRPIADIAIEAMPTISELLRHVEALPHWVGILRAFVQTCAGSIPHDRCGQCARPECGVIETYDCLIDGSTLHPAPTCTEQYAALAPLPPYPQARQRPTRQQPTAKRQLHSRAQLERWLRTAEARAWRLDVAVHV